MKITLATPTTIRLDFPYNAATKDFIKSLGGIYEGDQVRTWLASVRHLRTLANAYPTAQIDKAVIEARYAMWKRLIRTITAWGIDFAYTPSGVLVCYPAGDEPKTERDISPTPSIPQAMLDFIASHTAQLAPWLAESIVEPVAQQVIAEYPQKPVERPVLSDVSRGDELIMRGMRNAAQRVEDKAALVKRVKARRYQKALIEE